MGSEFGQYHEWNHDRQLEWWLTDHDLHQGIMQWMSDLNELYTSNPALWNDEEDGFEWISYDDRENSVLTYRRIGGGNSLIFVLNATPVARENYRIGVPEPGVWQERLNSDSQAYAGSNVGNDGAVHTDEIGQHGRPHSLELTLPPLGALILEPQG